MATTKQKAQYRAPEQLKIMVDRVHKIGITMEGVKSIKLDNQLKKLAVEVQAILDSRKG